MYKDRYGKGRFKTLINLTINIVDNIKNFEDENIDVSFKCVGCLMVGCLSLHEGYFDHSLEDEQHCDEE